MRPIAVVRAGDAESTHFGTHTSEAPPSRGAEPQPECHRAHLELSEDFANGSGSDRITPLSIPPPPGVPSDLVLAGTIRRSSNLLDGAGGTTTASPSEPSPAKAVLSNFISTNTVTPEKAASNRRKSSKIAVMLAALGAIAAVLGLLHGRAQRTPAVLHDPLATPKDQTPKLDVAVSAPTQAAPANAEPAPVPSVSTAAEVPTAAPAPSNSSRVALELMPIDAKLYSHGHEIPGPPFVVDVPYGKRLALEAKRAGYVTARVVIDGKKPLVHFGMRKEKGH